MNVVLIPTWNRPEFLYYNLERIKIATGAESNLYYFLLDHGYNSDCLKLIKDFPFTSIITFRDKFNGHGKQSRNLLLGYQKACELSDDLVYLIEEDIFINKDFFTFGELLVKTKDTFCGILSENNRKHAVCNDMNAYYHGLVDDYQSWGVVWKKETILEHIDKHIRQDYFLEPSKYCLVNWPKHFLGGNYCEQDGLIRRIKTYLPELHTKFPHVPRAYHAGIYGYNRINPRIKTVGSLDFKIAELGRVLNDEKLYRAACLSDDFYKDSKPIENNTYHGKELVYVEAIKQ